MQDQFTYSGNLSIGQHKSISVIATLRVEVIEDDEFRESVAYNPAEYVNGVKIEGELFFDTTPLKTYYENGRYVKHPVQTNVQAVLSLSFENEASRFNILLTDKTGEVTLVPQKLKRYFWNFLPIGNPFYDNLGIFPEQYRWPNTMNRVYICTDFRGVWPNGVSAVVVAPDKKQARELLGQQIRSSGLYEEGGDLFTLVELDTSKSQALILNRG